MVLNNAIHDWRKTMKEGEGLRVFHQFEAHVKVRTSLTAGSKKENLIPYSRKSWGSGLGLNNTGSKFQRKLNFQICYDKARALFGENGTLRLQKGHLGWCTQKSRTPRFTDGLQNRQLLPVDKASLCLRMTHRPLICKVSCAPLRTYLYLPSWPAKLSKSSHNKTWARKH